MPELAAGTADALAEFPQFARFVGWAIVIAMAAAVFFLTPKAPALQLPARESVPPQRHPDRSAR